MNDETLILELKKMNKFLEAIDWKLWRMFQKLEGAQDEPAQAKSAEETKSVVETTPVETPQPVISVPKYPSIEEWK
jgi:hypothetical protein